MSEDQQRPRTGQPGRPFPPNTPIRRGPPRHGAARPSGRPPYIAGAGHRQWASRRTISAQIAGLVTAEQELIAGRRPVEEAFAARREAVRLLVVPHRRGALQEVVLHATALRIPVVEVEGAHIGQLAGFDGHQGVALVVVRRAESSPEDLLARALARGEDPFLVALDGVEDPQNFGSLIRSAEAVGVHGIIIASRGAAPLSPAAIKASAGAVEHLLIARVDDLAETLTGFRLRGIRVVGAEAEAAQAYREANLRGPVCLVIGSEGHGLSPAVRRRVDLFVRIPMAGRVASLNAAVAGSVLLFEVAGQRPAPSARTVPAVDRAPGGPVSLESVEAAAEIAPDADPLPPAAG